MLDGDTALKLALEIRICYFVFLFFQIIISSLVLEIRICYFVFPFFRLQIVISPLVSPSCLLYSASCLMVTPSYNAMQCTALQCIKMHGNADQCQSSDPDTLGTAL